MDLLLYCIKGARTALGFALSGSGETIYLAGWGGYGQPGLIVYVDTTDPAPQASPMVSSVIPPSTSSAARERRRSRSARARRSLSVDPGR